MKKLSILLACIALNISSHLNAQIWVVGGKKIYGNGQEASKTVPIDHFVSLRVIGNLEVKFDKSLRNQVRIEAEENIIPYIKIKVSKKGKLSIVNPVKHQLITTNKKKIKIYIPCYRALDEISLSGSGFINFSEVLKAEKIQTTLRGSGKIFVHVETSNLEAKVSGSGFIELHGKAETAELIIRGAGKIDANNLRTKKGNLNLSGGALVKVEDSKYYNIRKSGSGKVLDKSY